VKVHILCSSSFSCSIKKLPSLSWDPTGSRYKQHKPAGVYKEQVLRLSAAAVHVEGEKKLLLLLTISEIAIYLETFHFSFTLHL